MSDDFTRYVILLTVIEPNKASESLVKAHVQHLKDLDKQGKLVLCGPFADHKGGMVIIKASSSDEAHKIAKRYPFIKDGYETYEIRTWELSCEENNHMGMG